MSEDLESEGTENALIPLITFENGRINFSVEVAERTFGNPRYRGFQISMVSVMGPSRSGKSFLMSVLTNQVKENQLRGAFQSGLQRFTEGILIFEKPIYLEDRHVIFFLDTQGTFDMQTDRNVSSWIAGFSLLISDIQMINLMGNIGGNDLHDIHLFVETAAAFRDSKLPKELIFVIRDTPNWDDETFLEKIWTQCENSSDLKQMAESLKSRFPNSIQCFCTDRASENIRHANGFVELGFEDIPLMKSLNRIKESLFDKCRFAIKDQNEDLILKSQRIIDFLENEAPKLKTTVKMGQEASVAMAVNKATEAFRIALKGTTRDTLDMTSMMGKEKVQRILKDLLKDAQIPEAQMLLKPKLEELLNEKRQEFSNLENDKEIRRKGDEFFARCKGNIQKIGKLEDALEMRRSKRIRREAESQGIELAETSFEILKNALDDRITALKSQFIQERLKEINTEMRLTLGKIEPKSVPSDIWLKEQVNGRLMIFRKDCTEHEILDEEWKKLEPETRKQLNSVAQNAMTVIKMKVEAREREEELQKEIERKQKEIQLETERRAQVETKRLQEIKVKEVVPRVASTHQERDQVNWMSTPPSIRDQSPHQPAQTKSSVDPMKEMFAQMEEQSRKNEEKMRQRREAEQRLTTSKEAPHYPVLESKPSLSTGSSYGRDEVRQKTGPVKPRDPITNLSTSISYNTATPRSSLAETAMNEELRILEYMNGNREDMCKLIGQSLREFGGKCHRQGVSQEEFIKFRNLMLQGCLSIAERKGFNLKAQDIEFPKRIPRFTDWDEKRLKGNVLESRYFGVKSEINHTQVEYQFKQLQDQDFKQVDIVTEHIVRVLIENTKDRKHFFIQVLGGKALWIVNRVIIDGWLRFFQTKPVNCVYFEDMILWFQMVFQELGLSLSESESNSITAVFGTYPRKNPSQQNPIYGQAHSMGSPFQSAAHSTSHQQNPCLYQPIQSPINDGNYPLLAYQPSQSFHNPNINSYPSNPNTSYDPYR